MGFRSIGHSSIFSGGVVNTRALIAFVMLLGLSSCAAKSDQVQRSLNNLEKKLNDLRSLQAEQVNDVGTLQAQLRDLTGRIEVLEHGQKTNPVGNELGSLRQDLSSIENRLPPPPIVPALALEADELLLPRLPEGVSGALGSALKNIRTGKYREALPLLEESIELARGGDGSLQALFWRAVCYDGLGDSRAALGAYNEVVSTFSRHERTALALLRLGSVFIRLGDSRTAKLTFQKLIAEFPRSSEAQQAKERLKDL